MTDNGLITGCDFLEGNGNVIAVVESHLPDKYDIRCQLYVTRVDYAIYVEGRELARFPMPNSQLYALLQGLEEIAVVEAKDGYWPDEITNVMDVVLLE